MGTHPIFESDFDCLTDKRMEVENSLNKSDANIINIANHVPSDISLKHVDLSRNQISYIPDNFGNFLNLKSLNLSKNKLDSKSFPATLSRLQMLEELNLSSNNLSEFPTFILELPRLRVLHLAENKISSLPIEISRLSNLERLYLGNNRLTNIPPQISQIHGLKILSLANNHMQAVPVEIGDLTNLISLQLHQNKINYLPKCIVELASLETLSLRGNPLISRFVRDLTYSPSSLVELAGRVVVRSKPDSSQLPAQLKQRIGSAKCCPNPACAGVYFDNQYKQIKFADFCGRYRMPLLQFLCSPNCMVETDYDSSSSSDGEYNPIRMRRVLLG